MKTLKIIQIAILFLLLISCAQKGENQTVTNDKSLVTNFIESEFHRRNSADLNLTNSNTKDLRSLSKYSDTENNRLSRRNALLENKTWYESAEYAFSKEFNNTLGQIREIFSSSPENEKVISSNDFDFKNK